MNQSVSQHPTFNLKRNKNKKKKIDYLKNMPFFSFTRSICLIPQRK